MFNINLQSREPIYEQLYNNVIKLVTLGVLSPEDKLPTVRALALELGVNPNTVSKAYQLLEREDLIYTLVGRGTFICKKGFENKSHKKNMCKEVEVCLNKARELGVTKEEIEKIIMQIYVSNGEEAQSND